MFIEASNTDLQYNPTSRDHILSTYLDMGTH